MKDTIELCNKDIKKKTFSDVVFFSIAESGAMGDPGSVLFFDKTGQPYHFNYVFGDVDINKVEKMFPVLAECEFGTFGQDYKVPEDWNYIYLGMGNHLIIHCSVYKKFAINLIDIEDPSEIYAKWIGFADSIFNVNETSMYSSIVSFLYDIENGCVNETKFEEVVYEFSKNHPELGLKFYSEILDQYNVHWNDLSKNTVDVSQMDVQGVMALIIAALREEHFCWGSLHKYFVNGSIEKWLLRLKELDEAGETEIPNSTIQLINGSCADQIADAVVNAANRNLYAGGGICGVIFQKSGYDELTNACAKVKTPLKDGEVAVTPAFNMNNANVIIHAVGPNFGKTPSAFKELFNAYYNSLVALMEYGYKSISFPLISSGIYGGSLDNPAGESAKQCVRAYKKFVEDYPTYPVKVSLCAFSSDEMQKAKEVFDTLT